MTWLDRQEAWPRIVPHLQRLCERQHKHGMTVAALTQRIQNGQYKVWVLGDFQAVFLTTLYMQQCGRLVLSLSWACGDEAIKPDVVWPRIHAYAKEHDCYAVEIMGRKGWERVMKPYGFEPFYIGIIKEL